MPTESSLPTSSRPERAQAGGLYDGFDGYRTPTDADYDHVLKEGLVVPDTNVLLNLYRYARQTRADLLKVLRELGDQLWIPNEVLAEFWRSRESAWQDFQSAAEETRQKLETNQQGAVQTVREWANRVGLPADQREQLERALGGGFTSVREAISHVLRGEAVEQVHDTNNDPVLRMLEDVLANRVGDPWEPLERTAAIAEGMGRLELRIPPGYMDLDKAKREPEKAVGDFLVWKQIMAEAEVRRRDVLIVTGDVKEDWWRKDHGETRGPRVELFEELKARAGARLFMTRPQSLLLLAHQVLAVEIREESVDDVERTAIFLQLRDRLAEQAPLQAAFTLSPTGGVAPLHVQFTDLTTSNPTSWAWSFGDGATSAVQHPTHVYQAVGVYTVSLNAANANGSSTTTSTITVSKSLCQVPNFIADSYRRNGQVAFQTSERNKWASAGFETAVVFSPLLTSRGGRISSQSVAPGSFQPCDSTIRLLGTW